MMKIKSFKLHTCSKYTLKHLKYPALNVGCGYWYIDIDNVVNIDIKKDRKTDICGDFLTYDFKEKFECIILLAVLEHVPEPIDILKRAYDLLTPSGILIIEVPFEAGVHCEPDYWRFTKHGLLYLCEKAKLKPKEIDYYMNSKRVRGVFEK